MANNSTLPGTGDVYASDDCAGIKYQRIKLSTSEEDATEGIGDTDLGTYRALWVDPRPVRSRIQVVPTISTSIYASGDNVGGEMVFANANRASGLYGVIESVVIGDKANQMTTLDFLFFDRAQTGTATDNSPFDPNDADLPNFLGGVTVMGGDYFTMSDNAVGSVTGLRIPIKPNATSLYGYMVVRATPTFASTTDLTITLTIAQD